MANDEVMSGGYGGVYERLLNRAEKRIDSRMGSMGGGQDGDGFGSTGTIVLMVTAGIAVIAVAKAFGTVPWAFAVSRQEDEATERHVSSEENWTSRHNTSEKQATQRHNKSETEYTRRHRDWMETTLDEAAQARCTDAANRVACKYWDVIGGWYECDDKAWTRVYNKCAKQAAALQNSKATA